MIRLASSTTRLIYKYLAKPILFMIPPDHVHGRLLKLGATVQKSRLVRGLLSSCWAYKNDDYLSQTVDGLNFYNPVGLSAGFDKNFELPPLIKSIGFGFMEGGSVTYRKCKGNPKPWFYRLPKSKSLVVNAGLANEGIKKILKRLESYDKRMFDDFPLNISVAKTNDSKTVSDSEGIADYIGSIELINKSKIANMITLNISCPNAFGGEPFTEPGKLRRLLKSINERTAPSVPVYIKMPSDLEWKDFSALLKVADDFEFIKGVVISNLAKNRNDLNLADPLPDSVKGNLSGKPVQDLSDNLIRQTYLSYGERFTIIGVGGIFSAEDAYKKIALGASLLSLVTGIIFDGPQLIGDINYGLVKLIKKDGFNNISQVIGTKA